MAKSVLDPFHEDIFFKYRNGVPARKIANEYGTTTTTVTTFLKNYGLMENVERNQRDKKSSLDAHRAVKLFNLGYTPGQIMRQLARSKEWFYSVVKDFNLDLRGHADDRPTIESLTKASKSRQENPSLREAEGVLFELLKEHGFNPIPQYSFDIYNVDFVIEDIAVAIELCCRGTSARYLNTGYLSERIKQLGDRGWHVYALTTDDAKTLERDGIQDLLAWLDFIKAQPSVRRQYRVVRSPGNLLFTGCCDSDEVSRVRPPEYLLNLA